MPGVLTFFGVAWGPHLEKLERLCLAGLLQPDNVPWLGANGYQLRFQLYTIEQDADHASEVCSRALDRLGARRQALGFQVRTVNLAEKGGSATRFVTWALIDCMKRCVEDDSPMVVVSPDMFIGNGSLKNLVCYADGKDVCVASPHVRVVEDDFLQRLEKWTSGQPVGAVSNSQLVGLALQSLHPAFRDAFDDAPANNTYGSGVSIRKLGDGLYGITHRLPHVFYACLKPEDVEYFELGWRVDSDDWDHSWPESLAMTRRLRVLGSSDLFFAVEATHREFNLPSVTTREGRPPDAFVHSHAHNWINGQFVATLRAEPANDQTPLPDVN